MKAAPFSEPREWAPCDECARVRYLMDRSAPEEEVFEPCPRCGQPPRCMTGGALPERHCKRPATVKVFQTGNLLVCGQHYVLQDLHSELDEWHEAQKMAQGFYKVAETVGLQALIEAMDFLHAHCEMTVERLEREIAAIEGVGE
jgi:hypothetical protein